jgi:hypothetical protein
MGDDEVEVGQEDDVFPQALGEKHAQKSQTARC